MCHPVMRLRKMSRFQYSRTSQLTPLPVEMEPPQISQSNLRRHPTRRQRQRQAALRSQTQPGRHPPSARLHEPLTLPDPRQPRPQHRALLGLAPHAANPRGGQRAAHRRPRHLLRLLPRDPAGRRPEAHEPQPHPLLDGAARGHGLQRRQRDAQRCRAADLYRCGAVAGGWPDEVVDFG